MISAVQETWQVRKPAIRSHGGLVVAQHTAAAAAGAEILAAGGNAVDAAIATSLALAVVEPWMSGLGGGGFMVVAPAGEPAAEVLDFGMVAPAAIDPDAYPLTGGADRDLFGWPAVLENRNVLGPLAIAVPGQAAGLGLAHRRHGRLPWAELCQPAIALARAGLPVHWHASLRITIAARDLARFDAARATYLPDGLPPQPHDDFGQSHLPLGRLAQTLERLAEAGPDDLVDGELARLLARDVQAVGGFLGVDDLANQRGRVVAPLAIDHGGTTVYAPGGLTAGPTLEHALGLIDGRVPSGPPGADTYLAWGDALFQAYERRLATMGDVDDRADPASTTHLVTVDRDGGMVSLTQTLLSLFGSKVVSPATGILLNNGIMWFDPQPGRPNSIAPGRRPLSNMCPVVGVRDGVPAFALGACGGRKILPSVFQLTSMLIDGGLDIETAWHTPRIDVSGGPNLVADTRLAPEVLTALEVRFATEPVAHTVNPARFATTSGLTRDPVTGEAFGAADRLLPVAGAVAAA